MTEDSWKLAIFPGWFCLLSGRDLAVTTRLNSAPLEPHHRGTSLWPGKAKLFTPENKLVLHIMVLLFIVSPVLNSKSYREEKKERGLVFLIIGLGSFLKVLLDRLGGFV